MTKTDIEWADYSHNPISGCAHGCTYCYAANQVKRFGGYSPEASERYGTLDGYRFENSIHILDKPLYRVQKDGNEVKAAFPFYFEPTFYRYRLNDPAKMKKPQNIFMVDMGDMFGQWLPDRIIQEIFDACAAAPWHNYLFLTKNPERYAELAVSGILPEGDNYWYGTTLTDPNGLIFTGGTAQRNTFVSLEPLLSCNIDDPHCGTINKSGWVIVGAMSGAKADKHRPKIEWISHIVDKCHAAGIPVFMKDSLIPIIGEDNMLREFPAGLKK